MLKVTSKIFMWKAFGKLNIESFQFHIQSILQRLAPPDVICRVPSEATQKTWPNQISYNCAKLKWRRNIEHFPFTVKNKNISYARSLRCARRQKNFRMTKRNWHMNRARSRNSRLTVFWLSWQRKQSQCQVFHNKRFLMHLKYHWLVCE